jgi:hypothetical protein
MVWSLLKTLSNMRMVHQIPFAMVQDWDVSFIPSQYYYKKY